MRFLLPLALLAGLLAAYFFLFGPTETPHEAPPAGTSVEQEVQATPDLEAAPNLATEPNAAAALVRSSEADAALVIKVVDEDYQPLPSFTLYLTEHDDKSQTLDGKNGSLGLADASRINGFSAFHDGRWSEYYKLSDMPEEGLGKEAVLVVSLESASLEIQIRTQDGLAAVAPWMKFAAVGHTPSSDAYLRSILGPESIVQGSNGVLKIEDLPPATYSFTASLEGYVPVQQFVSLEAAEHSPIDIEMFPAAAAKGRILANGKALAGANVGLLLETDEEDPFGFSLDTFRSHGLLPEKIGEEQRTTTNANGDFYFPANQPGKYRVLVSADDYLPRIFSAKDEIRPRQETDLGDFQLAKGFGLELVVRDANGTAIVDVETQWMRVSANSLVSQLRQSRVPVAKTDEEGLVIVGGLPAERITLLLNHPDYARHTEEYDFAGRTEIATDLLEITLLPGASVTGTVLDGRSGSPLPKAELHLEETSVRDDFLNFLGDAEWETTSDEEGRFQFARLPAGEYLLIANHEDFAETQHGPFSVEETAVEDIHVMLHPGATLHVEVLDSEGVPIAFADVQAINAANQIMETAETGESGVATLPPLKPGNYQVSFTDVSSFDTNDNTGSLDVQLKFVTLEANEERTITIGGLIPSSDLEGEIRRGGELMAKASVAIITPSGVKAGVADDNGWYEINDVPLGTYTMIVTAGAPLRGGSTIYDSIEVVEEGTMRHDILLSETGVEIHVTAAGSGEALANVPIAIRPLDGSNIQGGNFGLTDHDGVLKLASLEAGSYILSVGNLAAVFLAAGDAGLGSKQVSPIEIRNGSGIQQFHIQLEEGATFRARVRDSSGNLLKGAHLHYLDENGQTMNILSMKGTNSKGVAELKGLPSGSGIILVRHPNLGVQEVAVHLRAGELSKKEVTLQSGTRVYVTPIDADGTPLPGVLVTALDSRGAPASYVWSMEETQGTNAAFFSGGEQKLGPLLPGNYQIQLYRPGKPPVLHPLTVAGPEEIHLQLSYSTDER